LDFLQFRTEEPDERHKNRKIDLIPSGCGCALLIDGRTYSDFEPLMPIECKRLPTPKGPKRDEREYVFSDQAGVGGIQRFKAGLHGGCHTFAAMIGYVQSGTSTQWKKRVSDWITAIINTGTPGWAVADLLQSQSDDKVRRLSVLHSTHQRVSMQPIRLRHLWVEMN
jgi:hypothetical protein